MKNLWVQATPALNFFADLVLIQSLLSDKRMAVTTGSGHS